MAELAIPNISEMQEVNIKEAITCIAALPYDVPSMLWGEPGLGKTKAIYAEFSKSGHTIVNVLAGQSEPTDIGGIPFNFENKYAKYVVPWWGWMASTEKDVPNKGPMVLFFDDLVTAPEQTQAAFYKLVDEKFIGGQLQLRDNVRILAAGNRPDDLSAVIEMPKALCNRFQHYYVKPDFETWYTWATTKGRIHPHITFYLKKKEMHLSTFEDAKKSTNTHAWASPRTWEMLSKTLYALESKGLRKQQLYNKPPKKEANVNTAELEYVATQGCIGKLAIDFLTLVRSGFEAISPDEIVKDPKKCRAPGIEDLDILYSTVANLEHWFSDAKTNFKHYKALLTYALRLPPEFGYLLARLFVNISVDVVSFDEKLQSEALESKEFDAVMEKWGASVLS